MLSERERHALSEMLNNIDFATSFLGDRDKQGFAADTLRLYAVTRALEIVSEASRRLPTALKDRHPEVPWQQIAGAGNVYRHGYDVVSSAVVWQTVKTYLPALRAVVADELRLASG